jgi:hypothetical protein
MPRKPPPLTIVPSDPTGTSPPRELGKPGLSLWRSITSEFDVDDAGSTETLLQICAAADRLEEIAQQIAADGLAIRSKTGLRDHPLLKIELGLRSFVTRNLARLGVTTEPIKQIGRPGRGIGVTWHQLLQGEDY